MKVTKKEIDLSDERKLLINCILSTEFLSGIMPILDTRLLQGSHSKIIVEWIKEFYQRYEQAPKKTIQDIFLNKKQLLEESDTELIGTVLQSISDEHETNNIPYTLDQAELYLKRQKLLKFNQEVDDCIYSGDYLQAESTIANFTKLERPKTSGVNFLDCDFNDLLNNTHQTILTIPGALGQLIGPLTRDDCFGIFAPPKRGKTHMYIELAVLAFMQNLKVMMFSFEQKEHELIKRTAQRLTSTITREKYSQISVPFFTIENSIDYEIRYPKILTVKEIEQKKEVLSRYKKGELRFKYFPMRVGTIDDCEAYLDVQEYFDGFVPDVIIYDYPEIMGHSKNAPKDTRHFIDWNWQRLRSSGQKRNALTLVASQTNKNTFERDIKQSDPAEDSRKLAHITNGISLNQTDEEKRAGFMRIKPMVMRDDGFFTSDEILVLQSLSIGQPVLDSRWYKDVNIPENLLKSGRNKTKSLS